MPPVVLPLAVKTILDNTPLPDGKLFFVVWNREGTIVHSTVDRFSLSPTRIFLLPMVRHGNIKDCLTPGLNVSPAGWPETSLFPERETHLEILIIPTAPMQVDIKSDAYIFHRGLPALVNIRRFDTVYLAAFHPLDYSMEQAKGRITQDMMAFIAPDGEVLMFCNAFLGNLMPKNDASFFYMEQLTDQDEWRQLLNREPVVLKQYEKLLAGPQAGWTPARLPSVPDTREWVPDTGSEWVFLPDGLRAGRSAGTAMITWLSTIDQAQNDLRLEFTLRCPALFTVGVLFHVDVYRAATDTSSPDHNGYSFSLLRNTGTEGGLSTLLRKNTVPFADAPLDSGLLKTPLTSPMSGARIIVEKTAGAFMLSIDGVQRALLCDTSPLVSPFHHYIGFLGSEGVEIRDIRIQTRPTRFDTRTLPPDTVDLQFYKYPGHIFETRISQMPGMGSRGLRYVYMKDVTHGRALLQKLNTHLADIAYELETAKKIQNVLANIPLPKDPRLRFAYCYRPSREVGGDLFDIKTLPDGRIAILIYDVAGHGIAASLISCMAKMSFENALKESSDPSRVMERVNRDLCLVTEANIFLTAFLGFLNPEDGLFTYARAGHCPPVIFSRSRPIPLQLVEGGPILGNSPEFDYPTSSLTVEAGDRLLFYTDGIVEIRSLHRKHFDQDRLFAIMKDSLGSTVEAVRDRLKKEAEACFGEGVYEDDITFIITDVLSLGAPVPKPVRP